MALQIDWERDGPHMVVRLSGTPELGEALTALERIALGTAGASELLVDMRGVTTLTGFTDQFALGQAAASRLAHLRRVASVVPAGRITRNSERPAREGGLDLRVFESEDEAAAWLRSD